MRAVVRFFASVLATSGVLLVGDAAATLTWQEPLSSLLAAREQAGLTDQLERSLPQRPRKPCTDAACRERLAEAAARFARSADRGGAIGRIELPTLERSYAVVEGTSRGPLRRGPGHYPRSPLPGQRGTVAVAGHRTTYLAPFRTINRLRRDDDVVLTMPYGRFTYRVERTRIVAPTATEVTRRVDHDRLVLTACHPLYSAAQRIVVFARLASEEPADATGDPIHRETSS